MDKYGPLIVVSMCSLFTFAAALLFSLSESLFFTYVGRSLVGFFVGVAWIASVKSIQDEAYFDGKKQILTGFSMSLGMLGGLLVRPAGSVSKCIRLEICHVDNVDCTANGSSSRLPFSFKVQAATQKR